MHQRLGALNPWLAQEKAHLVSLLHLPSMNPRRLNEILALHGSPAGAWEAVSRGGAGLSRLCAEWQAWARGTDVEGLYRDLIGRGIEVLVNGEAGYPAALATIHAPPVALFVRGRLRSGVRSVAVVGARRATPYGLQVGRSLAEGLSRAGVCVVSGAAWGIDTSAHVGALAGGGSTVAVLGCGVDLVYPRSSSSLFEKIVEGGALISEYVPGTEPRPHHFPARNRIIAGMCEAVVVVEASEKSGALITAESALEEGREVMAVPGQVFSANSRGPHSLVRAGAALVRSAADVLEELGLEVPDADVASGENPPAGASRLLDALEGGPLDVEGLAADAGLPVFKALAAITDLELRGLVVRGPGGLFQLVRPRG